MGAFCVFGMSRTLARQKAEKKVETYAHETPPGAVKPVRRELSMGEWAQRVSVAANHIFDTAEKAVKISPEFDAPQFCRDWLAVSPGEVKLARVMVRGPKIDKKGKEVMRGGGASAHLGRVHRQSPARMTQVA